MQKKVIAVAMVAAVVVVGVIFLPGREGTQRMYWWTPHAGSPTHVPWHSEVEELFNRLYGENVRLVKVDYSTEDFKNALETTMAGGNPPDVWHSWGGGVLKDYVDAGRVEDLTDLLREEWAVRLLPLENRSRLLWNSTWNGRNYGFPYTVGVVQIYVNRSLFDAFGVRVPNAENGEVWTWDEFMSVINTFKGKKNAAGKDIYPLVVAGAEEWQLSFYYMYLVDRIGGPDYFRKALNGEPGYSFTDNVFIQAGEKCMELVAAGAFQPGFINAGYDVADYLFFENQAAMYLQGSWMVSTLRFRMGQLGRTFPLDAVYFPGIPGGAGRAADLLGGTQDYLCVSKGSKFKEEAFNLIRLHGTEDIVNSFLERVGDILAFDSRIGGGLEIPENRYDPVILKQIKLLGGSRNLLMPWDQYAPRAFALKHLELMNRLFSGRMTPSEVAVEHQRMAEKLRQEGKLPISFG